MLEQIERLGKVSVTIDKYDWDINRSYDKLVIVSVSSQYRTYISRKPVPSGTPLTDNEYWIPFSSLKEDSILDFTNALLKVEELEQKIKTVITGGDTEIDDKFSEINNKITQLNQSITTLNEAIDSKVTVTVANESGNGENVAISQKFVTDSIANLTRQIENINTGGSTAISKTANITLNCSTVINKSTIPTSVLVTATVTDGSTADNIKLYANNVSISENTNVSVINSLYSITGNTTFKVECTNDAITTERTLSVKVVDSSYVVTAADLESAITKGKLNPLTVITTAGNYSLTSQDNDYIFIIIPVNNVANVNGVKMSGYPVIMDAVQTTTIDGVSYKYYKSSAKYKAGTLDIVIS